MKVSVCMSSYNGEKFIGEQIQSILEQSVEVYEIIIIDDFSVDATVNIIENFNCERIKLFKNSKNLGYVKTFEKSISQAAGDIIFLSDQDDVWHSNKVCELLQSFKDDNTVCTFHNLHYVDSIKQSVNIKQKKYRSNPSRAKIFFQEFFRPRIFGCSIAFRRSLLQVLLPFPLSTYTHDHFIILAACLMGTVQYVEPELIDYRRHSGALTKHFSDPVRERVKNRLFYILLSIIIVARKFKLSISGIR